MTQEIKELREEIGELKIELVQIRTSLDNALEGLTKSQSNAEKITVLEKIDSRQQGQLNLIRGILVIFAPFLIAGCIYTIQQNIELGIRYEILQEKIVHLENNEHERFASSRNNLDSFFNSN